ncbi:MAG: hypothetical protein JXA49_02330 [Actinobacteria bacterium]|nr:hypothetical protein [Actinomycetota bacterium]
MKDGEQFVKKYHRALVKANRDSLEKMKPRIASQWINEWKEQLDGKITDGGEFTVKFEEFLTDELGFADRTRVSIDDGQLLIDVSGCAICPGNDLLSNEGEPSMCPILSTGIMAISRVLGKKATLEGVDKEGKEVGYCTIKYDLAEKGA